MALVQEAERELAVNPSELNRARLDKGEVIFLGEIDKDNALVAVKLAHHLRNVCEPNQPRVWGSSRLEYTFGLEEKPKLQDGKVVTPIVPLVYNQDLKDLGEERAGEVLSRIRAARRWEKV